MWNPTLALVSDEVYCVWSNELFVFPTENYLSPEDLATLMNVLQQEVKENWYGLGVELGVQIDDLDAIKVHKLNDSMCLLQMLSLWLTKTNSPPPSWQRVAHALCSPEIGKPTLAQNIRKTYCSQSSGKANLLCALWLC